ncbi:MAG TPA: acyl-CoA thioesterase domain-containing protein [Actinocrinis sp.]|jgi:acyl-CoA thioesterase-2
MQYTDTVAAAGADPLPTDDQAAVDELVELLDVTAVTEPDDGSSAADPLIGLAGVFQGRAAAGIPAVRRMYGGLIIGQALTAAGRTVAPGRPVHSLHGYFTRRGNERTPITLRVENLRDGNSISTRRTVAVQGGAPIFFLTASFHDPDTGLDHQPSPPQAPPPDAVATLAQRLAEVPDELGVFTRSPVDMRYMGNPRWTRGVRADDDAPHRAWLRVAGKLPDDPLIHAAAMAYLSDLGLLDSVLVEHGETWGPGGYAGVSIDHTIWFHRPCRADDWLLWDLQSPWASAGRGLATGRMHTADGRLVLTAAQEGLVRRIGGRRPR